MASSERSLYTLTWAIIGAAEALPIVTYVSNAFGPVVSGEPSGLNVTWNQGTSSVAAGRWSTVQVMALPLFATANRATSTRHVNRAFFILEISSLTIKFSIQEIGNFAAARDPITSQQCRSFFRIEAQSPK